MGEALLSLLQTIELAVLPLIALFVVFETILNKTEDEKKRKRIMALFRVLCGVIVAGIYIWSLSRWFLP